VWRIGRGKKKEESTTTEEERESFLNGERVRNKKKGRLNPEKKMSEEKKIRGLFQHERGKKGGKGVPPEAVSGKRKMHKERLTRKGAKNEKGRGKDRGQQE